MSGWKEVSKRQPCPICDKPDWCTRNGEAVHCMRIKNAPPGWKVRKECDDGGVIFVPDDGREQGNASTGTKTWAQRAKEYRDALPPSRREALADELGVSPEALKQLGVGYCKHSGRYTFPECNGDRGIIGIVNRQGKDKRCMKGSKRGLTIPLDLDLDPAKPLLIVEGASDTAAALSIGLQAVGRPSAKGGKNLLFDLLSGDWSDEDGGEIFVIGENDRKDDGSWPGRDGARDIARHLARTLGRPVRWVLPPEEVKDLREWIRREKVDFEDEARCAEARDGILESLRCRAQTETPKDDLDGDSESGHGRKPTIADNLVQLAERAELFHDGDIAYATVPVGDHVETWPIKGSGFRRWLAGAYYREYEKAANSQAMQDALGTIEAKARFGGLERPAFVRFGHDGDAIYLDLGEERWLLVRITADGWTVQEAKEAPVRFYRPKGVLPLPIPEKGGRLDDLRSFVNTRDDRDFILLTAWLIGAFQPEGPYPLLCLSGEQGSAKSTTCRLLRKLIDPNQAPLRSEPREERDLFIAAKNSRMLAFDNLSYIRPQFSDALCRIATGGGFATRTLYTDEEETIFAGKRPILINGIEEVATRPDLLDRSILITLPAIDEHERKEERDIWRDFERERPRLLGALLDAAAAALRHRDKVTLKRIPRMADFARWVVAAEAGDGLPWAKGDFLDAYMSNRAGAVETAIEASPVGPVLLDLLDERGRWEGSAGDLLRELEDRADEKTRKRRGWPSKPQGMAGAIRRLGPALRAQGWNVDHFRERGKGRKRIIVIEKVATQTSESSETSETPDSGSKTGFSSDDLTSANRPALSEDRPNRPSASDDPGDGSDISGIGQMSDKNRDSGSKTPVSDGSDGSDDLCGPYSFSPSQDMTCPPSKDDSDDEEEIECVF